MRRRTNSCAKFEDRAGAHYRQVDTKGDERWLGGVGRGAGRCPSTFPAKRRSSAPGERCTDGGGGLKRLSVVGVRDPVAPACHFAILIGIAREAEQFAAA